MFTGIIETMGTILEVAQNHGNLTFKVQADLSQALKVDQSVAHDGVCLTIEAIAGDVYEVTAIEETLQKTNLSSWTVGRKINLERCMVMNGRLDGHIVQGHVDTRGTCEAVSEESGSWVYRFNFPDEFAHLIIEKGSIAVNGTSLTCFDVSDHAFSVAIIPYTYEHTSISQVTPGTVVNLEFDVIGKYIARMQQVMPAVSV